MNQKQFAAICAKNDIAREVRDAIQNRENVSTTAIMYALRQIEAFIGKANQPSVSDIVNTSAYRL